MTRRKFLWYGSSAAVFGATWLTRQNRWQQYDGHVPAYGVIPVVGDGNWIWKEPPKDQLGYLEPRQYDVRIGMQLKGKGAAAGLLATTAVPVEIPEQVIQEHHIHQPRGALSSMRRDRPKKPSQTQSCGPLELRSRLFVECRPSQVRRCESASVPRTAMHGFAHPRADPLELAALVVWGWTDRLVLGSGSLKFVRPQRKSLAG